MTRETVDGYDVEFDLLFSFLTAMLFMMLLLSHVGQQPEQAASASGKELTGQGCVIGVSGTNQLMSAAYNLPVCKQIIYKSSATTCNTPGILTYSSYVTLSTATYHHHHVYYNRQKIFLLSVFCTMKGIVSVIQVLICWASQHFSAYYKNWTVWHCQQWTRTLGLVSATSSSHSCIHIWI